MGWWLLLGVGVSPARAAPRWASPAFEGDAAGSRFAC